MKQGRRKWVILAGAAVFVVVSLVAARLYLDVWLKRYVNEVLANIEGYHGSVADIDIDLYRGAYRIHRLELLKTQGKMPVPFLTVETVDLSVQWNALLQGRIVSDIDLVKPAINVAVNASGTDIQAGQGVDWTRPIQDLMPIDINLVTFTGGTLTYRDFSASPDVHLYIRHMKGELRNLRNVVDATTALPSTLSVTGDSIGKGTLAIQGRLNILRPVPDMAIEAALENVHLPALNTYSRAYAGVDFEAGKFNLYSELAVKDSRVSGYIKPMATDIAMVDFRTAGNPVALVWESVVSVVVEIFTNQPKDQFATRIPLEGNLDAIETDTWSAIAGIIRNAFVQALDRGVDD